MEKLKVGDKVVCVSHQKWGDNKYYSFDEVERLTKTQAILKNGTRLINEPNKYYFDKEYSFVTHGDSYSRWNIVTAEIIEEAKKEKERQAINSWFSKQNFTQEERVKIYNLFNNK